MATGKTHGKHVTVTYNSQDISDDVKTIGGLGVSYDEVDVSGLEAVRDYVAGMGDSTVVLTGSFDNTASSGAHTVLSAANGNNTSYTLTVAVGIRTAPAGGDPEFEGGYITTNYLVNVDPATGWTATLKPAFGAASPAWGTV